MSSFRVQVRAPSNIALIKYMGKKGTAGNHPDNTSLSMTLQDLCTWFEIEGQESPTLEPGLWIQELPRFVQKEKKASAGIPQLNEKALQKMETHFQRIAERVPSLFEKWGMASRSGIQFHWRTANAFPAGAGIASSASSFAAATLATVVAYAKDPEAFRVLWKENPTVRQELALISREGSGSSCRSLEGPWVRWTPRGAIQNSVQAVSSNLPPMSDLVLLVQAKEKTVSSSEAHQRVKSSPLWAGRVERAEDRVIQLQAALEQGDLSSLSRLVWQEMWEMHSLFHTAWPPFSYVEPETIQLLKWLEGYLEMPRPPIVTLDAGPNIHVLVPTSEASHWREKIQKNFQSLTILEDRQGNGAEIL